MATWDIARLRQIAGVPLNESYDDDDGDDGLSKSERELASKAEGDLKKKGIKVGKVDPDKDMSKLATRRKASETKKETDADADEKASAAKAAAEKAAAEKEAPKAAETDDDDEDDKGAEKKDAPAAKAEEKKEDSKPTEAAAEAKRKGKAPNPESFNQHAKANAKGMTRGQFLTWAAEKHGKGKAYSSALFAKYNPKSGRAVATDAKECFMISHPALSSYFLHENKMMNQMQWVDLDSDSEPMIFETKAEAEKIIQYMSNWKGQTGTLVTIDLAE